MLSESQPINVPDVDRLVQAWAAMYPLEPYDTTWTEGFVSHQELFDANSAEGRALTCEKLNAPFLHLCAEIASLQANNLYRDLDNVTHLGDMRRVAAVSLQIYERLVTLYAEDALGLSNWDKQELFSFQGEIPQPIPRTAAIVTFAEALESLLLEFQRQHQRSLDWRSIGFLTTQMNFCNVRLLLRLSDAERILILPYLRFVEEQVAHPWQRVCAAAIGHSQTSPVFTAVEKIMRLSHLAACSTFSILRQRYPEHCSRRGSLVVPQIRHSCVRDLKMFQSYLCLCILQGSMGAVQDELLDLCIRVLPSVGVQWKLIANWTPMLTHELLQHLGDEERMRVLPYATKMHQIFLDARSQFDSSLTRSPE